MLSYRSTVAARYETRILARADVYLLQTIYPAFCSEGTWSSFPRPKRPGRDRDHSLPSSADIKNEWSCTFSSPYSFTGCSGTALPCLPYDTFCCRDWFWTVDVMIHAAKLLYCFHFYKETSPCQWRTGGEVQPPRNSKDPPKSCQTQPDCENC